MSDSQGLEQWAQWWALVSMSFLFAIAFVNLTVLRSAIRTLKRVRRGESCTDERADLLFEGRGFLARLVRPLFRLITKSWHMYFLGFLFGLGFDTAAEVGLLGMSAAGSSRGSPLWSILIFPLLFTAAMALVDTTDSILMQRAYGWAHVEPLRKLSYNIIVTGLSVGVALVVGSIEGLGLLADMLKLEGNFWEKISRLNDRSELMGYSVVAAFFLTWIFWSAFANTRQSKIRSNAGGVIK